MTDYYQADYHTLDDLELSQEELEEAEDLAIQVMFLLEKSSVQVATEALYACQEMLDDIDRQMLQEEGQ